MARRINPAILRGGEHEGEGEAGLEVDEKAEGAEVEGEKAEAAPERASGLPGGALGVPRASDPATHVMPGKVSARVEEKLPQYRVVNGGHVMYGGCRTVLRPGKLVDAYAYDLELLRRQGIQLEELK